MRRTVTFAISALLLTCGLFRAWADEPVCIVSVQGAQTGAVEDFHDVPGGVLIAAQGGLFRYDGARAALITEYLSFGSGFLFQDVPGGVLLVTDQRVFRYSGTSVVVVGGPPIGCVNVVDTAEGVLLGTANGLFRYDGASVRPVIGPTTGWVSALISTAGEVFVGAENGLFRYDGVRVLPVEGQPTGRVSDLIRKGGQVFVGAEKGLFRYDGVRVSPLEGQPTGAVERLHDIPNGLLIGSSKGLYRFDGVRIAAVRGVPTGEISTFHDTPSGVLLGGNVQGLFRYKGGQVLSVEGGPPSFSVKAFQDAPGGVLVEAYGGLFRYIGERVVPVAGAPTTDVNATYETSGGVLIASMDGLFWYDGARAIRVQGAPTGPAYNFHAVPGSLLVGAENGVFRAVLHALSESKITLDNFADLRGAAPSQLGIPTHWEMVHACSAFADQFSLFVVATNANGKEGAMTPVVGFHSRGESVTFEAAVPVPEPGTWRFQIVSMRAGKKTNIGRESEAVTFVKPGVAGWFASWWQTIVSSSAVLLIALNLLVLVTARYSPAAWRLATDESWGNTVLSVQRLLLRHWRAAQLWLLDFYVQQRRKALVGKSVPFLALPLTSSVNTVADSDAVLARITSTGHLWVQGGAGMGKTAIFTHLRQIHFGGPASTAFALFRHHGYVLVSVEARRFPEGSFDIKRESDWVLGCVLSVLSEGGLSFEDSALLRAMLRKGTLAVAIDGLNEVSREQAVANFAAEFPATRLFVTSQESGELPFEVWHLPRTIAEHVDALLALYLGEQQAKSLASRLRDSMLVEHLRSGYDVRLVIDLAEADSTVARLPRDRTELYRAAVSAAWPKGDDRLELLQAAAWKLVSERGPNEDKRRLKPDEDAPRDLLEDLEAVRERSGSSIRLIRAAPPGYEFVHDQMNAYLAACWFADRPTIPVMCDLLEATKVWQDGLEAQRTLWGFLAAMLEHSRLEALWIFAGDDDRRAVLGRALAERAEQMGWTLTRPSARGSRRLSRVRTR